MNHKRTMTSLARTPAAGGEYDRLVSDISRWLEQARRGAARSVNAILTATYWQIGCRIVEHEQGGKVTSEYGEKLLERLSADLTARNGRGFSRSNVAQMRAFYAAWEIVQTPSGQFEARAKCSALSSESATAIVPVVSGESESAQTPSAKLIPAAFPLSWSHYVRLMAVDKPHARAFYESEAIRGGWSVRQLDRQIGTQFLERTAHSKRQAAMLARGHKARPEDAVSVKEHLTMPGENEPTGIILCSDKDDAVVKYAMGAIRAQVFASKYLTELPDPETLRREIVATQHALESRAAVKGNKHG